MLATTMIPINRIAATTRRTIMMALSFLLTLPELRPPDAWCRGCRLLGVLDPGRRCGCAGIRLSPTLTRWVASESVAEKEFPGCSGVWLGRGV